MTKHFSNYKVDLLAVFAYVSFAAMILAAAFGKDILKFLFM